MPAGPLRHIIENRVIRIALGLVAFYWLVLTQIVPSSILLEVLDSGLIAMSAWVLVIYLPQAIREVSRGKLDDIGLLIVGIALAWMSNLCFRLLAINGRAFGRVSWFIESPAFPFLIFLMIIAGGLHAWARIRSRSQPLPFRSSLIVVMVLGALLAGFFLGVQWGFWFADADPKVLPMTG